MPQNRSLAPDTQSLLMDLVHEREEQLLALAMGICNQLADDVAAAQIPDRTTAWRLAQLMESELSSTKYRNAIRSLIE